MLDLKWVLFTCTVDFFFPKVEWETQKINIFCVFLLGKNVAKGVLAGSSHLALFSLELPRAVKFPTALVLSWHFFGNRGKKGIKKKKRWWGGGENQLRIRWAGALWELNCNCGYHGGAALQLTHYPSLFSQASCPSVSKSSSSLLSLFFPQRTAPLHSPPYFFFFLSAKLDLHF